MKFNLIILFLLITFNSFNQSYNNSFDFGFNDYANNIIYFSEDKLLIDVSSNDSIHLIVTNKMGTLLNKYSFKPLYLSYTTSLIKTEYNIYLLSSSYDNSKCFIMKLDTFLKLDTLTNIESYSENPILINSADNYLYLCKTSKNPLTLKKDISITKLDLNFKVINEQFLNLNKSIVIKNFYIDKNYNLCFLGNFKDSITNKFYGIYLEIDSNNKVNTFYQSKKINTNFNSLYKYNNTINIFSGDIQKSITNTDIYVEYVDSMYIDTLFCFNYDYLKSQDFSSMSKIIGNILIIPFSFTQISPKIIINSGLMLFDLNDKRINCIKKVTLNKGGGITKILIDKQDSIYCTGFIYNKDVDFFIFKTSKSCDIDNITEKNNFYNINIYPNPFTNILYINFNNFSKIYKIQINDLSGKLVFTIKYPSNNNIDLSKINNGIYFINIYFENSYIYNSLIIKN